MLTEPDDDDKGDDPDLQREQELVRMIACHAVDSVEDILEIFDDEEQTGYFALAMAVAVMSMHRCTFKRPDKDERFIANLMAALRDGIKDIRKEAEEAVRQHRGDH